MLGKLSIAFALMGFCVLLHALALTLALQWHGRLANLLQKSFTHRLFSVILVAAWMVLTHLLAITVWGLFYAWMQLLPDFESAFYFSAVTYTTTGYGDYTLPTGWHLLSGVEALTGILMCGLSTGFFFAVVNRMLQAGNKAA